MGSQRLGHNGYCGLSIGITQTYHSFTKCTPFKALYGREPPNLLRYETGTITGAALEDQLVERDAMLDELKFSLLKTQNYMKKQEDEHRRDVQFAIGDFVYLKHRPCR